MLVTSCQPPPNHIHNHRGQVLCLPWFRMKARAGIDWPLQIIRTDAQPNNYCVAFLQNASAIRLPYSGGGTQHPVGAQNRSVIPVRFPSPEVVEESIHRSFCHEVVTQPAQGKTLRMPGPGFRCSAGVPSEFILASPNPL